MAEDRPSRRPGMRPADTAGRARRGPAGGPSWRRLAEVVALVGLVVTQPLLDVLGRSPDFFLFHRASPADVLLLVALVAWCRRVPFALLGALSPAGRPDRPGRGAHRAGGAAARRARRPGGPAHSRRFGAYRCCWWPVWPAPPRRPRTGGGGRWAGCCGWPRPDRWSSSALFLFASPASAVVLPRGDGGAAGVAGRGRPPAGGHDRPGRAAAGVAARPGRADRRRPLPALRRAGRRIDLVPQRHRGQRLDAVRAAGHAHRPLPGASRSPRTTRSTRTTCSPPSAACYEIKAEESITRLCPPSRCEQPASPEQGLGVLVRESGKLLRQVTAPVDSRVDPEDSYREQTRAEAGPGRRRAGAGRPEVPLGHPRRQPAGPVHHASSPGCARPPGPPCTSCTC